MGVLRHNLLQATGSGKAIQPSLARERRHENVILITLFVREISSKALPIRVLKFTQGVSGSNGGSSRRIPVIEETQ